MLAVALAAALAGAAACGPPASRPATGPITAQVRASLKDGRASFPHDDWNHLLAQAATSDGLVDYRLLQARREELDTYLERVARADLGSLAPDHLKALLINAYNALTVRSILDHPRVSSIREIDGVWTDIKHRVGGFDLTLDEVEHNLLRPYFRDPRIHFAVNCASRSCAPLPSWAYDGDRLEEQLEERTRAFMASRGQVRVGDGILEMSRIFDWYGGDFVAPDWSPRADTIPLFVSDYAPEAVATFIRSRDGLPGVAFLEYDWALNASARPDRAGPGAAGGLVARLRDAITGWGAAGGLAYVALYAALTVLFVPAWPLTVGAGAAYGVVLGTVLVSIGSTTGAGLAFLVARHLLRARVRSWVAGNARFEAIDRAVGREGWKIVGLTRLSPFFPFNLQNYAYGLTAVGFWPYLLISWIAMLPGTVLYVYIGAASADVAEAASGTAGWGRSALQILGLLATLLVTFRITRLARRALAEVAGNVDSRDHPG